MSEIERNPVNVIDDDIYITLAFDDGAQEECLVIGIFEVNGKEYIALEPNTEEDPSPYLYGYEELNETEFQLHDIEDDAEFQAVVEEFERLMAEDEE